MRLRRRLARLVGRRPAARPDHGTSNEPPPPDGIHISITEACFFDCRHCDLGPRPAHPDEPDAAAWCGAIDALRDWLGPCRIDFAGGEPLAKPGMLDLVSHAAGREVFPVLTTNAWLIDEAMADRIVASGLRSINVSLESTTPEIHDRIRGREGAHRRAWRAIRMLDERRDPARLNITVATVVMEPTLDQLEPLLDLAERHRLLLNLQVLYQNFGAAYDPHWFESSPLWPRDADRVAAVLGRLERRRQAGAPLNNSSIHLAYMRRYFRDPLERVIDTCLVGERMLAIDALGGVSLCFFTPPVGNLFRQGPAEIWASSAAAQRRRAMRACRRNCDLLNCNYQREATR